jgi:hypothetical protein
VMGQSRWPPFKTKRKKKKKGVGNAPIYDPRTIPKNNSDHHMLISKTFLETIRRIIHLFIFKFKYLISFSRTMLFRTNFPRNYLPQFRIMTSNLTTTTSLLLSLYPPTWIFKTKKKSN